ncbi:hypothetical protein MBLNU459_g7852t1 [Dothideomycetes sp. NU459]
MRASALIPTIFGLAAFVLSMLCIFAGSKKGFMEDYAIVTLNTSRLGENVLNSSTSSSGNILTNWLHNITNSIDQDIDDDISDLAKEIGIHDFYSAHLLTFCEGYYTPASVANSTLPKKDIHKNTTSCSNKTAFFTFDPTYTLQRELNNSGHGNVNLTDLHFPSAVEDGLRALRVAQKAAFILYCIAAGLLAVSALTALVAFFFSGRLSAFVNILIAGLAFLAILVASAITTAVAVKAARVVNDHGKTVGISATKGAKFLVITWVAAGLAFLNILVWMFECVVGHRRHRQSRSQYVVEK